jgi:hypothetical protein
MLGAYFLLRWRRNKENNKLQMTSLPAPIKEYREHWNKYLSRIRENQVLKCVSNHKSYGRWIEDVHKWEEDSSFLSNSKGVRTQAWRTWLFQFIFCYNSLLLHFGRFINSSLYFLFSYGSTAQIWALAASMKLSISFRLLDLGQSAGLLGRVISSSQGLCVSAPGEREDGEVGGMNGFGRGNRSTRRKPGPPRWEASD